nr:hypothetical protein [Novosphingobium panipatense]
MARTIDDLTEQEIKRMIANYDERGLTEGGKWPRAELVLAQQRKKVASYPLLELARKILLMAKASDDGRVSYGDLWLEFNDGPIPAGQYWVRPMLNSLEVLGVWCFDRQLPLINILVVNGGTREVVETTLQSMWDAAKLRGFPIPADLKEFALEQANAALALDGLLIEQAFEKDAAIAD